MNGATLAIAMLGYALVKDGLFMKNVAYVLEVDEDIYELLAKDVKWNGPRGKGSVEEIIINTEHVSFRITKHRPILRAPANLNPGDLVPGAIAYQAPPEPPLELIDALLSDFFTNEKCQDLGDLKQHMDALWAWRKGRSAQPSDSKKGQG